MARSTFLRRLVLLVLILPLTASPARAALPAWESAAGEWLAAFSWLGGPAVPALRAKSPSRRPTEKHGCGIDPAGAPQCDSGVAVVPAVTPKSGCGIDPAGAPHCSP